MQRQLTYLRDGHFMDSSTAELTSTLVARLSDSSTFALVEIHTEQMRTGGFKQRAHVWSIQTLSPVMPKWQLAKRMAVQLGPVAFAIVSTGYLAVNMVLFYVQPAYSS
jgi:hypothetical protein